MKLSIQVASTSQTVNIFIRDSSSTTGGGLTGLVFNTASLTAYYALPRATPVAITLATLAAVTSAYSSGGFKELDATNMPGWYRLDIPDAALASGRFVSLHLKGATNMAPLPIEIELTGWNNQDAVRGGLTALPNANAAASGGLVVLGANATAISFTAGMTISSASGDALALTSSGANGNGLSCSGNGTADGIKATGGATGRGIHAVGGATSGAGIRAEGGGGNSMGIHGLGIGTGSGLRTEGGATGPGAQFIGGATSGDGIDISTTSGDGISSAPTAGSALVLTGNGTSKFGLVATGGTAGTSDGIKAVAGTGGVPIRGDITGNITGTLATVTTATNLTNAPTAGDFTAAMKTSLNASTPASVTTVTGNVNGNVGGSVASVTARVTANTDQLAGQTVTAAAGVTFPTSVASPTNITAGTITTATNLTNAPTSGDFTAAMKTSLNASTPASVTTVTGNVNGSVGSVAGNVTGSVGSVAGNVSGSVASVVARVTANTDQLAGQTVTAAAGVTFPSSVASPTNITAGTITTATNLTNAPTSGDFTATMKTSLNASTPASVTTVTGNVNGSVGSVAGNVTGSVGSLATQAKTDVENATWDAPIASHLSTGSTGKALNSAGSAGDPWATAIPGAYGAGTAGNIVGNRLDAAVSSRSTYAGADTPGTTTLLTRVPGVVQPQTGDSFARIGAAGVGLTNLGDARIANLDATVSSRSTYAGTDTPGTTTLLARVPGTVQPQTGDSFARLGAPAGASVSADIAQVEANVLDIPTSAAPSATANADALLGRNIGGGSNGGRTVTQALQTMRNKVTTTGSTLTVYAQDDTTVSWSGVLSTDGAALPIVAVDPA